MEAQEERSGPHHEAAPTNITPVSVAPNLGDLLARRGRSVWAEMPFMCGPDGARRLREWLPTAQRVASQAAERRRRVLAHDWARKRLCAILNLQRAEQWNGYVPPRLDDCERLNTDASRRALIELLREIDQRDQAEGATVTSIGA